MTTNDFSTLMRISTRRVHHISDTLVQSKFAFGLIDEKIWAEGLLVFYEIFRFLEDASADLPLLDKYDLRALSLKDKFETDLYHYYGSDWRQRPRQAVQKYLDHLMELQTNQPELLVAYVYHLYLGLLSGGQILKKRPRFLGIFLKKSDYECQVTNFDAEIAQTLKIKIKETTNEIAAALSEDVKKKILDEGSVVFRLNSNVIRSVGSTREFYFKLVIWVSLFTATVIISNCLISIRKN